MSTTVSVGFKAKRRKAGLNLDILLLDWLSNQGRTNPARLFIHSYREILKINGESSNSVSCSGVAKKIPRIYLVYHFKRLFEKKTHTCQMP